MKSVSRYEINAITKATAYKCEQRLQIQGGLELIMKITCIIMLEEFDV